MSLTLTEKTYPSGHNIERIKFIEPSTLEVEYQMGKIYHYKGITEEQFKEALEALSIGKWVSDNIKGKYPYVRMPDKK